MRTPAYTGRPSRMSNQKSHLLRLRVPLLGLCVLVLLMLVLDIFCSYNIVTLTKHPSNVYKIM
jgi:hypothetical protein